MVVPWRVLCIPTLLPNSTAKVFLTTSFSLFFSLVRFNMKERVLEEDEEEGKLKKYQ